MKTPDTTTAVPSAPSKRKFSPKSTAVQAQYARLESELRSGPKNTIELRKAGIMAPAARVKEMNDKLGFYIPTIDLITIFDDEGFSHPRVAVYELISTPDGWTNGQ